MKYEYRGWVWQPTGPWKGSGTRDDQGMSNMDPDSLNRQELSRTHVVAPVSAPSLTESRLVTLSDGSQMYADPGWNEGPNGLRVYLRKDLSIAESAGPGYQSPRARAEAEAKAKAKVDGNQAKNPGSPRQLNPGQHIFDSEQEVSIKHGAWSPRRVDPVAAQLVETAVKAVSWLADPTYGPALFAWARAEARCQLVAEYLDKVGPLDEKGEPRGALNAADRLESLALKHRTRLGLDPVSRALLEATLTSAKQGQQSLAEAMERGAAALEARRAASGLTQGQPDSPSPSPIETTRPPGSASPVDPTGDRLSGPNP